MESLTLSLPVPRVGRCNVCGRQVPGILKVDSLRECEEHCPRCGASPFYLDNVGPYTGNVAIMDPATAIAFAEELEETREIEVCFRLEIIGHWPEGRREVLEALYAKYWEVALIDDPFVRARILSLDNAIIAWRQHLANPEELRHYSNLVRVPNDPAPGSMQEVAV